MMEKNKELIDDVTDLQKVRNQLISDQLKAKGDHNDDLDYI